MSNLEIWEAVQTIRNTLIQSHVQMNHALDQIEKLLERIREDIAQEADQSGSRMA